MPTIFGMNTNKVISHATYVANKANHVGVLNRATTIPNRKRVASREACRKKSTWT